MSSESTEFVKKVDVLQILDRCTSIQGVSHQPMLMPKDYQKVIKKIRELPVATLSLKEE
ncbi:MAG: hypothetical protein KAV87_24645 [Desulfobacteraceae bacterium]|nr:hypothetical protein [Desulfobacteraceae bacterium]